MILICVAGGILCFFVHSYTHNLDQASWTLSNNWSNNMQIIFVRKKQLDSYLNVFSYERDIAIINNML